jgi:hypothetical protein
MDSRLRNELLRHDETKKYGLLLDAADRDVRSLQSQLDFLDGNARQDIESAILTTSSSLSSLSLNAGMLLADITGKRSLETIGKVVADVIRSLGAIAQTVATISTGSFAAGGYGTRHARNIMPSEDATVTLHQEKDATHDAVFRLLTPGPSLPITSATWVLPLKARSLVTKQIDRFQIAKTADLQRDVSGSTALAYTTSAALTFINPTALPTLLALQLASVISRHDDSGKWINVNLAAVTDDSLETATKVIHQFDTHVALPVKAGTLAGAFTNFNDSSMITTSTNQTLVARGGTRMVARPVTDAVALDERSMQPLQFVLGDIWRHSVHAVNALTHDAVALANSVAKVKSGAAIGTGTKIVDITEEAMNLTTDALQFGAEIYQEYVTRHTTFDTPDNAIQCIEDNDRQIVQYIEHGHKTKGGNESGLYDGNNLTGYTEASSHGHTPPVDLPPQALITLKDDASGLEKAWRWVTSIATSSSQEDLMIRSYLRTGMKTSDQTELTNVTGGFDFELSWTLATSVPSLNLTTGYARDGNGNNALTSGINIYWTQYNNEYFILAYYDGSNWIVNTNPIGIPF